MSSAILAPRRRLALVALLLVAGCSSLLSKGDDALARGDFVAAADWYQRAYQREHTEEIRQRRDDARGKALAASERAILAARDARNLTGTLAALSERALMRGRWDLGNRYTADEERWILDLVRADVAPLIDARRALAAETALLTRLRQIDIEAAGAPLVAEVRALGERNCGAFDNAVDDAEQPYLAQLVARYCGHFGGTRALTPPADAFRSVTLLGRIDGFSDEAYGALKRALDGALTQTGWYDPASSRTLAITLAGANGQRYSASSIVVDRPYLRSESYQEVEHYQESYLDTEWYTEQESYQDTESYSSTCYSGGHSSSCTQTRSVTRYRPVTRTRMVTRYRPATRVVTRWRSVPDVFHFEAVEHVGNFWSNWSATAALVGDSALVVGLRTREQESALEHDVSFPPAQVAPSDGRLTGPVGWQQKQVVRVSADFVAAGRARWRARSCDLGQPTAEQAARCVRQEGASVPAPVLRGLETLFGGEVEPLLALL
jgi:hypothetical protein